MLKASVACFPSSCLPSPPILLDKKTAIIRLSILSSFPLPFSSSFNPPKPKPKPNPSSISSQFSFLSTKTSPPTSPIPTSIWWALRTAERNTARKGTVSFSTKNQGEGGREILVQHLLVSEDNLKLLVELQQRIAGGEDLSDLAVEYSICPSKENGGMLGWVRKGQMVPEFEDAAFGAPLNEVVKCKTKFGWHLLQVLSEREESLLQDIEPEELHAKMQDPSFIEEAQLIDVREPDEVATASLPGFKVLPLRQFGSWGGEIMKNFDPQKDIYVLCHHGSRSLQVAKWLQTQGFKKVFNVAGGIHAYALKADASIPTY